MLLLRCLTPKEKFVYDLLIAGLPCKAIASRMKVSVRTVDSHASSIYRKLGTTRKTGGLLKLQQTQDINEPATELCRSKEQRLKVYQLKKEGLSIQEIAVKLRITRERVYRFSHSIQWFIKTKGRSPKIKEPWFLSENDYY